MKVFKETKEKELQEKSAGKYPAPKKKSKKKKDEDCDCKKQNTTMSF